MLLPELFYTPIDKSSEAERDAASPELRDALQVIWYEAHRRRRERHGGSIDDIASCAKTRPFRNRPQISSLDALGIRAESRVFRAAGLTSDPWAGG